MEAIWPKRTGCVHLTSRSSRKTSRILPKEICPFVRIQKHTINYKNQVWDLVSSF